MKKLYTIVFVVICSLTVSAQSFNDDWIDYRISNPPKNQIEETQRQFKVTVTSPYNVTAESIIAQSKVDFENTLKNYATVLANSEKEYQEKLKNYDQEVAAAKAKFELESAEFKKLTLIERMSMTEQGRAPRLVTPNKPVYVKPYPPVYQEPNLNNYVIVNNDVLATQINVDGFTRGQNILDIVVDIQKIAFQDNAGQTYAKQPTKISAKVNGVEKAATQLYQEFKFISSSPSNNINKPLAEKNFLAEVMASINRYLNEQFGYKTEVRKVKMVTVKNKGKYDDLEKAHIYISTNLRKLDPQDPEISNAARNGIQKGVDALKSCLAKVDYKDKKADYNAKIASNIYMNLIRLNLALNQKSEAEKNLNDMQENLIYMDLNRDDTEELKNLESQIYKMK